MKSIDYRYRVKERRGKFMPQRRAPGQWFWHNIGAFGVIMWCQSYSAASYICHVYRKGDYVP